MYILMHMYMYVAVQRIHGSQYKGIPVESTPSTQTTQPLFHFEVASSFMRFNISL